MPKSTADKYKAWDKRNNTIKWVLDVSFEEEYVTFKKNPDEKVSFSDIELMKYMGISAGNRKGIYAGDIVRFYEGIEAEVGLVVYDENNQWFFEVPMSGRRVNPWDLKQDLQKVEVIGNKYENENLLSDHWVQQIKLAHMRQILSSHDICEEDRYCKHDIQVTLAKLSTIGKEDLIELIDSLADDLRYYKKAYFEESARNRQRG